MQQAKMLGHVSVPELLEAAMHKRATNFGEMLTW